MGSLSIWHWLIILFFFSIYIVPIWRILNRAGYSGAWTFLSFIQLLNIIMLWVFAFSRWPNERT